MARIIDAAYFLLFVGILQVSGARVGGWRRVEDTNSEKIQDLAKLAVTELESSSNGAFKTRLHSIVKAETQVVSGVNYRLTLKIGTSNCRRNVNTDVNSCDLTHTQKCTVTYWVRVWLNSTEKTNTKCGGLKPISSADRVGGQSPIVDQLPVQNAATFAASAIGAQSNGQYSLGSPRVKKSVQQMRMNGAIDEADD